MQFNYFILKSKTSQKLGSCIKSNYCFFTGLWTPADPRGTTASGQTPRLTLSYKPLHHRMGKETVFTSVSLFSTDTMGTPNFPHGCRQEVTQLPKKPFINWANWPGSIPIYDWNAIVLLQMSQANRKNSPELTQGESEERLIISE